MSTQAERVKVVQTEFERLQQYLTALPEDAWTTPSACALFAVCDVVAHLIWVANTCTDGITRGRQDDTSTPAGGSDPSLFTTRSQEERQQRSAVAAQRRIAIREGLGDTLLSVFGHTLGPLPSPCREPQPARVEQTLLSFSGPYARALPGELGRL